MTEILVTTTVEITDNMGRKLIGLTRTQTAQPGDNGRFFATYTRGACQGNEHALAQMLITEYGDKPDD